MPTPEELQQAVNDAADAFDDLCYRLAQDVGQFEVPSMSDPYTAALAALASISNAAKMQAIGLMLQHGGGPKEPQVGAKSFISQKGDKDK